MPNKHFYFALGAASGFMLVSAVQMVLRKKRAVRQFHGAKYVRGYPVSIFTPFLFSILGCIALVPDALYLLNILPKDVIRSPGFNLFWGYPWFESIEDQYPVVDHILNALGMIAIYFLALHVFGFYIRECRKRMQEDGFQ